MTVSYCFIKQIWTISRSSFQVYLERTLFLKFRISKQTLIMTDFAQSHKRLSTIELLSSYLTAVVPFNLIYIIKPTSST